MFNVNPFGFLPLITAILIFLIGVRVIQEDFQSESHRALFYFCLSLFIWLGSCSGMYFCTDPEIALFWARTSFSGVAFISFTSLYFNLTLFQVCAKRILIAILSLVSFGFASLSYTSFIYPGVQTFFWGYYPKAGFLHPLFLLYFLGTWFYGVLLVYRKMRENKAERDFNAYHKNKYIFMAWSGVSLTLVDFLPSYGVSVYPFAYGVVLYWTTVLGMTLLNYHLLAHIYRLSRSILIACYVGGALIVFYVFHSLISTSIAVDIPSKLTLLIVAALVVLIVQPIYKKTKHWVDQHFFPEYSDRKPTLEQLGKTMVHTPDPHQFNLLVLDNIHALLRPIKSLFFVLDACEHRFKMIAAREWGVHLPVESPITLDKDHSVVHYLSNYRFLYLNEIISDRSLALWLLQQKVSLGIPVKVGGELKAFFLLGDKESGLPYSMQDIKDLCQIAGLMAVVAKSDELAQMQVTLQKLVDARSQQLREIQDELVQKERLAAIGSLAGEVSHELRNPLQVIGNARYILEKRLNKTTDPKVRSQIQMLKSQVSSMSRIIGNMLDFTRNRRLILETCSIHELLREVVHLVEVPSNIKVRFKFSSIIPEVTVDVQEFRQALINLMTNACEAMSQGGALTIETQLLHEDHMEIKIKDTGCGIPPEYLNRLFEPFSTTKVRGNGLGMAVVKKVINQHHGTIEVESTVGEGTCFIIQQPIKVTETEEDLPVHKIYNGLV